MPNKQYIRGRRKEYKIIYSERAKGRLAFRSAGSHSPIDVVSIDYENKEIFLIQSKPDTMSQAKRESLEEQNKKLNGTFFVKFMVI